MKINKAFTLIELLIVVAIIAILAAIAVPNFLEAQVRAKVSRVKADMRSIAMGLETYCVDYNNFPPEDDANAQWAIQWINLLTTPVAYLTSVNLQDPFKPPKGVFAQGYQGTYFYVTYNGPWAQYWMAPRNFLHKGFIMHSYGPMRTHTWMEWYPYYYNHRDEPNSWGGAMVPPVHESLVYDSSNGTVSWGGIGRAGGELPCPASIGG